MLLQILIIFNEFERFLHTNFAEEEDRRMIDTLYVSISCSGSSQRPSSAAWWISIRTLALGFGISTTKDEINEIAYEQESKCFLFLLLRLVKYCFIILRITNSLGDSK